MRREQDEQEPRERDQVLGHGAPPLWIGSWPAESFWGEMTAFLPSRPPKIVRPLGRAERATAWTRIDSRCISCSVRASCALSSGESIRSLTSRTLPCFAPLCAIMFRAISIAEEIWVPAEKPADHGFNGPFLRGASSRSSGRSSPAGVPGGTSSYGTSEKITRPTRARSWISRLKAWRMPW